MRRFKVWVEIEAIDEEKGEYINLGREEIVEPMSVGVFERLHEAISFVLNLPGLVSHPNDLRYLQRISELEARIKAISKENERTGEHTCYSRVSFVSEWDDGSRIQTAAVYDPRTRKIVSVETAPGKGPSGSLIREYIVFSDGTELEVCQECHDYTLKTVVVPDMVEKGQHEETECPNPECGSK